MFKNNPYALIVDVKVWLYASFPDASRTKKVVLNVPSVGNISKGQF